MHDPSFLQREDPFLQSPSKGVSIGNLGLHPLGLVAEELIGKESQMFIEWKVRRTHLGSLGADMDSHHALSPLVCFFGRELAEDFKLVSLKCH